MSKRAFVDVHQVVRRGDEPPDENDRVMAKYKLYSELTPLGGLSVYDIETLEKKIYEKVMRESKIERQYDDIVNRLIIYLKSKFQQQAPGQPQQQQRKPPMDGYFDHLIVESVIELTPSEAGSVQEEGDRPVSGVQGVLQGVKIESEEEGNVGDDEDIIVTPDNLVYSFKIAKKYQIVDLMNKVVQLSTSLPINLSWPEELIVKRDAQQRNYRP